MTQVKTCSSKMKRTPSTIKDLKAGSKFYFPGSDVTAYTVVEIKQDKDMYDITCVNKKFPFREKGTKRIVIIEETE